MGSRSSAHNRSQFQRKGGTAKAINGSVGRCRAPRRPFAPRGAPGQPRGLPPSVVARHRPTDRFPRPNNACRVPWHPDLTGQPIVSPVQFTYGLRHGTPSKQRVSGPLIPRPRGRCRGHFEQAALKTGQTRRLAADKAGSQVKQTSRAGADAAWQVKHCSQAAWSYHCTSKRRRVQGPMYQKAAQVRWVQRTTAVSV